MKFEVKVPAVGESVTEATVGSWMKQSGDAVQQNEVLLLLETDKASVEIVAEKAGQLEIKVQAACRHGIRHGWIESAHDSAEGGLAVALAECCISGNKGAAISIGSSPNRLDEVLFGEGGARIIVSIDPTHQAEFEAYIQQQVTDSWQYLGAVGTADDHFQVTADTGLIDLDIAAITDSWANAIERRLDV